MARNEKLHGYQWLMLSSPVTSWKIAVATSAPMDSRSAVWRANRRTLPMSNRSNSLGKTVQSFTSSNGTAAVPAITCTPWVTR